MKLGKKLEADKSLLYTKKPKQHFSGKTPNILIGEYGYPNVNVGALVDEDDQTTLDNPKQLAKTNNNINNILKQRQSLINTQLNIHIKDLQHKFTEQTQDIAKSSKIIDSEVELEKPLNTNIQLYKETMPHGPTAKLKQLEITTNPKIPKRIEQVTSDTDVKATTAMNELTTKGYDEYYLTKLLSTGTLGIQRKIVPTKWSITAVDDSIGKQHIQQIQTYQELNNYEIYTGNYLGNYYTILLLPGAWSYELLEIIMPETDYNKTNEVIIARDYEHTQGRKTYAHNTSGGYYAARLPIIDLLKTKKRQARCIVLRTITKEYTAPLGVWVVREGIRQTLENKTTTADKQELLQKTKQEIKKFTQENILQQSILLKQEQHSLRKYF